MFTMCVCDTVCVPPPPAGADIAAAAERHAASRGSQETDAYSGTRFRARAAITTPASLACLRHPCRHRLRAVTPRMCAITIALLTGRQAGCGPGRCALGGACVCVSVCVCVCVRLVATADANKDFSSTHAGTQAEHTHGPGTTHTPHLPSPLAPCTRRLCVVVVLQRALSLLHQPVTK